MPAKRSKSESHSLAEKVAAAWRAEIRSGDLAPGTSHLRTGVAAGQALMRGLRGNLSGLCQPTYVLDIPDSHGKVPIGPDYLATAGEVEDPNGGAHPYPPRGD